MNNLYHRTKHSIKLMLENAYYFSKLPILEKRLVIIFLLTQFRLSFHRKTNNHKISANTFISLKSLLSLSPEIHELYKDETLKKRILDFKIAGVRMWEYGLFLYKIKNIKKQKLLDLGAGNPIFSRFLSSKGWNVVAMDLEEPQEKPIFKEKNNCFIYKVGNMLKIPEKNSIFDAVICISAIEHLGYNPSTRKVPNYGKLITDTKKALIEMCRVLKKGGYIYITTDAYDSRKQFTDRGNLHRDLGEAYYIEDIFPIFIDTLKENRIQLLDKASFSPILLDSQNRSNYPGRFFTTFAIFGIKK